MNSVQNGLCLGDELHTMFDHYVYSINPNVSFSLLPYMDSLLRWHFRQAVLTNMSGKGEAAFESHYPPHSDMIGDILADPKAAERFGLFDRLAHHVKERGEGGRIRIYLLLFLLLLLTGIK